MRDCDLRSSTFARHAGLHPPRSINRSMFTAVCCLIAVGAATGCAPIDEPIRPADSNSALDDAPPNVVSTVDHPATMTPLPSVRRPPPLGPRLAETTLNDDGLTVGIHFAEVDSTYYMTFVYSLSSELVQLGDSLALPADSQVVDSNGQEYRMVSQETWGALHDGTRSITIGSILFDAPSLKATAYQLNIPSVVASDGTVIPGSWSMTLLTQPAPLPSVSLWTAMPADDFTKHGASRVDWAEWEVRDLEWWTGVPETTPVPMPNGATGEPHGMATASLDDLFNGPAAQAFYELELEPFTIRVSGSDGRSHKEFDAAFDPEAMEFRVNVVEP